MKKILVCGGRDFNDYDFVAKTLNEIVISRKWHYGDEYLTPNVMIINGGARGADTCATDWAVVNWLSFKEYKADWEKYGKSAGIIRNREMLNEECPDLVVAFPGGAGTEHMIRIARKDGYEVLQPRPTS